MGKWRGGYGYTRTRKASSCLIPWLGLCLAHVKTGFPIHFQAITRKIGKNTEACVSRTFVACPLRVPRLTGLAAPARLPWNCGLTKSPTRSFNIRPGGLGKFVISLLQVSNVSHGQRRSDGDTNETLHPGTRFWLLVFKGLPHFKRKREGGSFLLGDPPKKSIKQMWLSSWFPFKTREKYTPMRKQGNWLV